MVFERLWQISEITIVALKWKLHVKFDQLCWHSLSNLYVVKLNIRDSFKGSCWWAVYRTMISTRAHNNQQSLATILNPKGRVLSKGHNFVSADTVITFWWIHFSSPKNCISDDLKQKHTMRTVVLVLRNLLHFNKHVHLLYHFCKQW